MADSLRQLDNPEATSRILASRGTHIILKGNLVPEGSGIIIPKTKDGRLLFIVNYFGNTMVGTTDDAQEVSIDCQPVD
jgi:glycerol-3-phosphate dehydrogenase